MDFQTRQDQAKQNTTKLVVLLGMGVLAIVAVVSALFTVLLASGTSDADPVAVVAIAAPVTATAVVGTSLIKSSQIKSGGGSYVATSMGGRKVDVNTSDPAEHQLLNVVEEIAIASGTPMPAVFVLDDEPSINAFAAGWTAEQTAIGVTRGALVQLDRHELQGVIGHEFSHIINGDTKIKTRIIGWVFGIAALTVLGRVLLYQLLWAPRRRRGDDRTGLVVVAAGFGLLIIGAIGTFFARLVQAAVSRQREYLADASAVQFTRDPAGLGHALMKIGGEADHKLRAAHATEAGHLFISSGFTSSFATHPPLADRIRRLIPDWDGNFIAPEPAYAQSTNTSATESRTQRDHRPSPPPGGPFPWFGPPPGRRPPPR